MQKIKSEIAKFLEGEKDEALKALLEEKNIVCINPDSYIAKEIKYQTALLHEIKDVISQNKFEIQKTNRILDEKNRLQKRSLFKKIFGL